MTVVCLDPRIVLEIESESASLIAKRAAPAQETSVGKKRGARLAIGRRGEMTNSFFG